MPTIGERIQKAWNAFRNKDPTEKPTGGNIFYYGPGSSYRPDRKRFHPQAERSIIAPILNRMAVDASTIELKHVQLDDQLRYKDDIKDSLNDILTTEANIDQTARAFKQDLVMSMLDEGVVAAVPVDTTSNPRITGSYDIQTMRTAKILEWYPRDVKLSLYNDRTGNKEEIILPKSTVAIIENPLYAVMNEPISTLKRLIYKFNLLDSVDETISSGKLDLIVQLPYPIKTEMRRQEAEKRRKDLETQLSGNNKYGIAYTDGTEKFTQLSRPVENKLMDQIEYLTSMLYSQLGMTKEVFDGTADERIMMNYISRTVEPIVSAISDEFNRKFLTKTARSQRQKVMYFNDIFKLATADSMTANGIQLVTGEVITKNELRQRMGYKPIEDQGADQLMNPNINPGGGMDQMGSAGSEAEYEDGNEPTLADMKVSDIP